MFCCRPIHIMCYSFVKIRLYYVIYYDDIMLCAVPADSLPDIQGLQGEDLLRRLLELDQSKRSDVRTFDPENLVHQVDRGDSLVVRQLLKDHPEKVSTV